MRINDNFEKLPESYLFSEVAHRLVEYKEKNPEADLIRMDIGDVTRPIFPCVTEAMKRALDEMGNASTFRGYGPEQGYSFLREAIAENDYRQRGIDISADDIFISDGAKSDLGNLGDIYSENSIIAIPDPGYPVYCDTAVMSGRAGELIGGKWSGLVYLPCLPEQGMKPLPPAGHADVVMLCSPSNPTGAAFTYEELSRWVDYARRENALIIYDSAYEAFVRTPGVTRSIYEIPGAETVAIEVRSFSKTAGFTGLRCGYTVVPSKLIAKDSSGNNVALRKLWLRRQTTKFNGVGYPVQRGAAALYTPQGQLAIRETIDIYLRNAMLIREEMQKAGYTVFGGADSPYVWVKAPAGMSSWDFFAYLLENANISCTPGIGFGSRGEGYVRLTGFNTPGNTRKAMDRILKIPQLNP